ncbi:MAG TPA: phenylalanine--tRNA ligase subunit alpha [Planctomycetota bacterium]|jgi:phenylalanyl-tRNA synthetase alpha chain|nr:phenylalanine--tRNA ligase subunit alpha [Planctomycetota bacterium]MDP6128865.1 phenylalanine--tRNA ligase subunit alpha [Planctomycetota bacterium]MDP7246051.1 phenylalanine--tRNA ligase subunit alpha [Planctomycetota bacterium]HJM39153.1 phenylalanine--tRNA ligase subunit alpha [Planctomycetota bacterium]|tara:strand:+ start:5195 stop:6235 length:1041 start_codon:yes stop_codon:yes gene_type:complete
MRDALEELRQSALEALSGAGSDAELREVEVQYLGRNGELTSLLKQLGSLSAEERPLMGKLSNEIKGEVQASIQERRKGFDEEKLQADLLGEGFDPTLPGPSAPAGGLHPLTRIRRELEDLFSSMGFYVVDGPELEMESNNFDALNIPGDHPARESHDTIWVREPSSPGAGDGTCMRTHTSPVQVRALRKFGAPLKVIAPGRVFRQETQDATHDHTFHQMEGLVVGKGVGVSHMLHAMNTLLEGVFGRKVETRLRPGFFPFVEPGFELDARCPFCEDGCRVCKGSTWIELMPGGLVHPHVLKACDVDPEHFSGFAFGLGLSRMVMLRYGINDIRWMLSGDLRFLEQF